MRIHSVSGVIFDFDGVLADTEEPQIRAWAETAKRLGITVNERQIRLLSGYSDEKMAQFLFAGGNHTIQKMIQTKEDLTALIAPQPIPRYGAREVLIHLSQLDLPVAIVSSTPAAVICERIASWKWQNHWVKYIIGGSPEIHPKPSPTSYYMALEALKVDSRHCVVIEDTLPGLEAAFRAGCMTIGLAGTLEVDDLCKHADCVIEDLAELIPLLS